MDMIKKERKTEKKKKDKKHKSTKKKSQKNTNQIGMNLREVKRFIREPDEATSSSSDDEKDQPWTPNDSCKCLFTYPISLYRQQKLWPLLDPQGEKIECFKQNCKNDAYFECNRNICK